MIDTILNDGFVADQIQYDLVRTQYLVLYNIIRNKYILDFIYIFNSMNLFATTGFMLVVAD